MITIAKALQNAAKQFVDSPTPALDAEILLEHVMHQTKAYLYANPDKLLTSTQLKRFNESAAKRAQGMPIAYITKHQGFWDLDLIVTPDVLIPRPETEILVEIALTLFSVTQSCKVIDLGTGSGAIALALAHECSNWQIIAIDDSVEAISVAKRNASHLKIKNINFILGDFCHEFRSCETRSFNISPARNKFAHGDSRGRIPILPLENSPSGKVFRTKCETHVYEPLPEEKFDLIISNPPYIAEDDPHLTQGDVRFEPKSALVAGRDGLDVIRKIAAISLPYLKPGGYLLLEHGYDQAERVRSILAAHDYQEPVTKADLAGHPRASYARKEA